MSTSSKVTNKTSIQLVIFFMQSKEMYKLTPQLCRLAKQDFHDMKADLPDDVSDDVMFENVINLIEHIEKSEFAKATEILGDAYKGYDEMQSYISSKSSLNTTRSSLRSTGTADTNTTERKSPPSIFEEDWEPPTMRPGSIPTPPAVSHRLNEDDRRNWNDMSPAEIGRYDNDEYGPKHPKLHRSMDDVRSSRYMTTLRPRDGKPDYEMVYVSNSPAVLAHKFTELYKSEWKAAHEELTVILGDKQSIRHMLWIIAKASIICASLATQQLQDLENSAIGIMVSRDPLNKKVLVEEPLTAKQEKNVAKARLMLVDYRREISKLSVPLLQTEMRKAIASELGTTLPRRFTGVGNHFIEYANTCIEIIWLMYVHDPPMHLEWLTKEQEGTPFYEDQYDVFTRPGKIYDYCVWPVVRLHRDGPVLAKGIAQCR